MHACMHVSPMDDISPFRPSQPEELRSGASSVKVYVRKKKRLPDAKYPSCLFASEAAREAGGSGYEEDKKATTVTPWDCDPHDHSRFLFKYSRRYARRCLDFGNSKRSLTENKVKVKVKEMARKRNLFLDRVPLRCVKMRRKELARCQYLFPARIWIFEYGKQVVDSPRKEGQTEKKKHNPRIMKVQMDDGGGDNMDKGDVERHTHRNKGAHELSERIHLFLSHMRQVQGDRKFQPWKSTIMDSLMAAFLTQNVLDVLSSSVFMELASKFPFNVPKAEKRPAVKREAEYEMHESNSKSTEKHKAGKRKKCPLEWGEFRRNACTSEVRKDPVNSMVDWREVEQTDVNTIAQIIEQRGQNNRIAERMKNLLTQLRKEFGSTELEWLREIHPSKTREFLSSIYGLGCKSIDCITLLTLHEKAFPVDTNVARICIRLGWVPIKPLPEKHRFHIAKSYPLISDIRAYLWPRLCELDVNTLYELHYQMITFGKVFCRKSEPNCIACPMKMQCKYFESARKSEASANLTDIEDGIHQINTDFEKKSNMEIQMTASVSHFSRCDSVRICTLKNSSRARTEQEVYHLPDSVLNTLGFDHREAMNTSPYLFLVRSTGESCGIGIYFSDFCEKNKEALSSDMVKGTILIPCQVALQGKFPLNGTYFQSNEVFADQDTSINPIDLPGQLVLNLPKRSVYFGNSIQSICKGWTIDEITSCFNKGYICVRGFDRKTGAPRPLVPELHDSKKWATKKKEKRPTEQRQ